MPSHPSRRSVLKASGLGVAAASSAGCLSVIQGGGPDEVAVGGKNFTEQFILSQISMQLLEEAGVSVTDNTGLGGSSANFQAITNDEIDHYWEYTGTGWHYELEEDETIRDPQELKDNVDEGFNDEFDIDWLERATADNTYVILGNPDWYEDTGIETMSELAEYIDSEDHDLSIAMSPEMVDSEPAWAGVPDHYGFDEDNLEIETMKIGLAYQAIAEGNVELGIGFKTNPNIQKFELPTIEDDENFYVVYNPVPIVRNDTFTDELKNQLNEVPQLLDTETLRSLNAKVSIDGQDPKPVAEQFLSDEGLI